MRRSTKTIILLIAGAGLVVAVVAAVIIQLFGTALAPMAPVDIPGRVDAAFRHEFPTIYYPLLVLPGYAANHLHLNRGLGGKADRT